MHLTNGIVKFIIIALTSLANGHDFVIAAVFRSTLLGKFVHLGLQFVLVVGL